jgi:hypothetical protein
LELAPFEFIIDKDVRFRPRIRPFSKNDIGLGVCRATEVSLDSEPPIDSACSLKEAQQILIDRVCYDRVVMTATKIY